MCLELLLIHIHVFSLFSLGFGNNYFGLSMNGINIYQVFSDMWLPERIHFHHCFSTAGKDLIVEGFYKTLLSTSMIFYVFLFVCLLSLQHKRVSFHHFCFADPTAKSFFIT